MTDYYCVKHGIKTYDEINNYRLAKEGEFVLELSANWMAELLSMMALLDSQNKLTNTGDTK